MQRGISKKDDDHDHDFNDDDHDDDHDFNDDDDDDIRQVGALVDATAPGLCPGWKEWQTENKVSNSNSILR